MERDPFEGGTDVGRRPGARPRRRAAGVDPRHRAGRPGADRRRRAGQRPRPGSRVARRPPPTRPSTTGRAARGLVRAGVPAGRDAGPRARDRSTATTCSPHAMQSHAQPLVDDGPGGHPGRLHDPGRPASTSSSTATTSCRGASSRPSCRTPRSPTSPPGRPTAPWSDEVVGRAAADQLRDGRRPRRRPDPAAATSSSTCSAELGRGPRSWSGSRSAHLLTRRAPAPGDEEFAAIFAEFVVEQSGGADEPIDRRVFELVDGRLVEFAGWRLA